MDGRTAAHSSTGEADGRQDSSAFINIRGGWTAGQQRIHQLERRMHNANVRHQRSKKTIRRLMQDLQQKTLLTEELHSKLRMYAGVYPLRDYHLA